MTKEERVTAELARLKTLFANVNKNKQDFCQRQIEQLAWFHISIIDLQKSIDSVGTTIDYNNGGGQSGTRVNPDVKTLLDLQKSCNTITRTLIPFVPDKHKCSSFMNLVFDNLPDNAEGNQQGITEGTDKITSKSE